MTEEDLGPRKRLRVGHRSERGGINAVRTLLERHGLVVDEVEGRSDYGRDLTVDITEGNEVTGAIVGVQVKGDRTFVKPGAWELPVSPKDRRYWADSGVPIMSVLWDPQSEELRWENLTAYALSGDEKPARVITLPPEQRLTDDSLPDFLESAKHQLRRSSATALLDLFDSDDDRRTRSVYDCWSLGRSDARAFLLLRWALPGLRRESARQAIVVLSHLTPHPDIAWNKGNWVPASIKAKVTETFRWSPSELYDLVSVVEHQPEHRSGWERGGPGQCLWCLLVEDPELHSKTLRALGLALENDDLDSAFRLLVIHQYGVIDPLTAAEEAVARYPGLDRHPYTSELLDQIRQYGFVSVY